MPAAHKLKSTVDFQAYAPVKALAASLARPKRMRGTRSWRRRHQISIHGTIRGTTSPQWQAKADQARG
jgi:hypothetical protein